MKKDIGLIQGLEVLKERFRLDIDEHENYNLIQNTINKIDSIEEEIKRSEKYFISEIEDIESAYADEVYLLDDTIDELIKEIEDLERELNDYWHKYIFDV